MVMFNGFSLLKNKAKLFLCILYVLFFGNCTVHLNVEVLCDAFVVYLWTGEHSFARPELEKYIYIFYINKDKKLWKWALFQISTSM